MNPHPKSFVSHSTKDRDFVHRLATDLRGHGVDAWYAEWEIGPGDSIVERIDQGLRDCEGFVIVLSTASVASRWVRTELDAALLRRIQQQASVIPVRIEPCDLPPLLAPLFRVHFDEMDYEAALDQLVRGIFRQTYKPPLGPVPTEVTALQITPVDGLSQEATVVLRTLLELHLEKAPDFVSGPELRQRTGLSVEDINDAVAELKDEGALKTVDHMGTDPYEFGYTELLAHAILLGRSFLPYDPAQDAETIAACLCATDLADGEQLQRETNLLPDRINWAIDLLEGTGYADVVRGMGTAPYTFIRASRTPALRRRFKRNK